MNKREKPVLPQLGFQARIYNDLEEMPNRITVDEKSNAGRMAAMLLMWKRVADIAKKKYEGLQKSLITDGVMIDPKTITTPGDHYLGGGGNMAINVKVTQPRREFNQLWFITEMEKRHKIPQAVTLALMEEAKKTGTTQNREISVTEKGAQL